MTVFDRRSILKGLAGFAGTFVAAARAPFAAAQPRALTSNRYRFPQGVASGDPQPDGIVLWTRVAANDGSDDPIDLRVQISNKPDFTDVVLDEAMTATKATDHTLRIVIQGLDPDTIYFYRFAAGGDFSRLGRTRTAPLPDTERPTRFAFASCQNYEQGFYGAWARMLADDLASTTEQQIDFVLFLGDFIYEVRGDRWNADMRNPKWLKGADGRERIFPPFPNGSKAWPSTDWNKNPGATNAVTLADYRFLYRLYLSDAYLQAARARWPFVSIWDDHEFTNDGWQTHDTYLDQGGQPAQKRKVAANQAWFEYIPALLTGMPATGRVANPARDFKPVEVNNTPYLGPQQDWIDPNTDNRNALASLTVYRALRWGKTLEVVLTDNRSYKSPPPRVKIEGQALQSLDTVKLLDLGRTANEGEPPATIPDTEVPNPRRVAPRGSVLGPTQKAWFKEVLQQSPARWKVWANPFPALPFRLDMGSIWFAGMNDAPLGIDGWNGYPAERKELLEFIRDNGVSNVVACAGDHHMHMAGLLLDDPDSQTPSAVAVEFAAAGISSEPVFPGAERASRTSSVFHSIVTYQSGEETVENFNLALLGGVNAAIARSWTGSSWASDMFWNEKANPGLTYIDTNANGYGIMSVNAGRVETNLVTVANPEKDHGPKGSPVLRRAKFTLRAWAPGQTPELIGPTFQGTPPFPFE
ncbi:MAG: alkaline phosphatase D family protein [Alphaproteobacteria bacterium]|nr:alkaline phosphatase D family protein [Alphaproteobacteria bacterium]